MKQSRNHAADPRLTMRCTESFCTENQESDKNNL
jgi:hypothetical protein